jgi:hypothetical protein
MVSMNGFLTRHEREQQDHQRRERHDQRKIDGGGGYARDIDRPAADEHAEEAGHHDAGALPAQPTWPFAQRR